MPKFVLSTKNLKEALSIASRNLTRNSPKEVYKGLFFQTAQDAVTLTATDGICKTTITIPADVQEEGNVIVVAEKFIQFIGKLDDEKVTIDANASAARIVYNGNHARIPVITGTFPEYEKEKDTVPVKFKAAGIAEALEKTMETKLMHYHSRSRNSLWLKGETSGHYQHVKRASLDCDRDTLLFYIDQDGAACHTGNHSCFFTDLEI